MDPRGLRVIQNAYISLMTHTKRLSLVIYCDTSAGIRASGMTNGWTEPGTPRWMDRQMNRLEKLFR